MLVLSRKKGESIIINDDIEIVILATDTDTIKVGIKAPHQVEIHRKEVYEAIQLNNQAAAANSQLFQEWLEEKK